MALAVILGSSGHLTYAFVVIEVRSTNSIEELAASNFDILGCS